MQDASLTVGRISILHAFYYRPHNTAHLVISVNITVVTNKLGFNYGTRSNTHKVLVDLATGIGIRLRAKRF
jgi:hypothetical protein